MSLAGQSPQSVKCDTAPYTKLDSRLQPGLLGELPKGHGPVVGFEVVGGKPVVAFPHSLLMFRGVGGVTFSVEQTVSGLSFDRTSLILLQSDHNFLQLKESGLEIERGLSSKVHGRLYDSGEKVFLEIRARKELLQIIGRREDGAAFPVAAIKGKLRAASWNPQGLAAVVGESLYVWQPGGSSVVRLLADQGLIGARDVVAVGQNRAILALKNMIVLVTPETVDVVGMMPMSRCRFQDGVLYVLQEGTGLIWSLRGLENLGSKESDQAYARSLVEQSKHDAANRSNLLAEASRILGCTEVGRASSTIGATTPILE